MIFGSTGLAGFLFYFGFVLQCMMRRAPAKDQSATMVIHALKWSFLPSFAVSLLIATTPDFGAIDALRWGAIIALTFGTIGRPPPARRQRAIQQTGHQARPLSAARMLADPLLQL